MDGGSGKPPACTITFAAAKSHKPSWQRRDAKVALLGANRISVRRFFQRQQLYVFVGVALFAVISALRLSTHLWTVLVFSLCIGNLTFTTMSRFERYYAQRAFPFNWLVYLPLLALVGLGSAIVATGVVYWLFLAPSYRTEETQLAVEDAEANAGGVEESGQQLFRFRESLRCEQSPMAGTSSCPVLHFAPSKSNPEDSLPENIRTT